MQKYEYVKNIFIAQEKLAFNFITILKLYDAEVRLASCNTQWLDLCQDRRQQEKKFCWTYFQYGNSNIKTPPLQACIDDNDMKLKNFQLPSRKCLSITSTKTKVLAVCKFKAYTESYYLIESKKKSYLD